MASCTALDARRRARRRRSPRRHRKSLRAERDTVQIDLTDEFRAMFPAGIFGALIVRGSANRGRALALHAEARATEERLRARFGQTSIDGDPVARAYAGYFRRFGNRYPVVHQAKTILAGGTIASQFALVEAMFTAEVDSLVLTSGHDLDVLAGPLRVDVARDGEAYTKINEKIQTLRPGDMVTRDSEGVIASVLYGPDHRTRLRVESRAALFGAWAPVGLTDDVVQAHLDRLAGLIRREWPDAEIEPPRLLRAQSG
jgi:DNA/RNA-binding domain of Phe-tRNA-synthetase-like protein